MANLACQFRVSTRAAGPLRRVTVQVYEDLAELREAATRYVDAEPHHFAEALGVCHAYTDGGTTAALIRLWRHRLGTSVVVHEVTHAAMGIYRTDWQPDHGHPNDDLDNEEVLAYLVGNLTSRIVDRLHHHGMYP
ncbi:hypothetical protein GA0115253_1004713 [Streptomyces sp. Termitarium-T10T-6]|nr:hypothetical protein [Streptomyces sp. Termitarium-T10T-6]SCD43869.1 hypothetical protein GA0115253_1004713 [Streptomyces sp. Termitarium-T10T-6]